MDGQDQTPLLVERAQGGDRKAFDELLDLHRPRLLVFVKTRLGEGSRRATGVEDICQETFLRALRSIPNFTFRGDESFFRWLAGIAGHVILESAKRARREPSALPAEGVPNGGLSQSKALRREERFDRLQAALLRLTPEHRQVILLARIEKLPLNEVAARMNRSPETTRKLLWRALRSLKDQFGDTESLHLPPRALGGSSEAGGDGQ